MTRMPASAGAGRHRGGFADLLVPLPGTSLTSLYRCRPPPAPRRGPQPAAVYKPDEPGAGDISAADALKALDLRATKRLRLAFEHCVRDNLQSGMKYSDDHARFTDSEIVFMPGPNLVPIDLASLLTPIRLPQDSWRQVSIETELELGGSQEMPSLRRNGSGQIRSRRPQIRPASIDNI